MQAPDPAAGEAAKRGMLLGPAPIGIADLITTVIDLLTFAAIGVAIGAFYFGRLGLVAGRLPRLHHPMLWLLAGTISRLALVLAAFLLLSRGDWARLVACLFGVVAAWLWLRSGQRPSP